jgi:hypothetical protein
LIALVRAQVRSAENVTEAERLRERLSRLHHGYAMDKTMTKAAYRDQMRALETAIRAAEGVDGPSVSARLPSSVVSVRPMPPRPRRRSRRSGRLCSMKS